MHTRRQARDDRDAHEVGKASNAHGGLRGRDLLLAAVGGAPADERRRAIVDAALRVFAGGSYSGSTTAEIAREAGISEPILYRHFASKRDLYLACLEAAWGAMRAALEAKLEELGDRVSAEGGRTDAALGIAGRAVRLAGRLSPR